MLKVITLISDDFNLRVCIYIWPLDLDYLLRKSKKRPSAKTMANKQSDDYSNSKEKSKENVNNEEIIKYDMALVIFTSTV